MSFKSIKELYTELMKEKNKFEDCNHVFYDEAVSFITVGRFGGEAVNIYKCKKCGYETHKENEYIEALSHYDEGGRPIT